MTTTPRDAVNLLADKNYYEDTVACLSAAAVSQLVTLTLESTEVD